MVAVGKETFGQRVRNVRVKQKVRQVDLAAKAGISWRHLIRIEQDRGGVTKPGTVARLAEALGVPKSELGVSDDDEEADSLGSLDDFLRRRVLEIVREEAKA